MATMLMHNLYVTCVYAAAAAAVASVQPLLAGLGWKTAQGPGMRRASYSQYVIMAMKKHRVSWLCCLSHGGVHRWLFIL